MDEDFVPYELELSPLTLLNGTAEEPLDGGRKVMSTLNSYKLPQLGKPDSWQRQVEWDGRQIRSYTADVAYLMRTVSFSNEAAERHEHLIAVSGMTSSGLMKAPSSERLVNGIQPPTLFSVEQLAAFRPEIRELDGEPHSITVPGMTSIDAVNEYVKTKYPDYEVYYDITTSDQSTVAANFFTGGLGDNRQGLDVTEMVVVRENGFVETLTAPEEIEALRATQGYACVGTEFTLRLKKVPSVEEMLVLDLKGGDARETYGESLPKLMEYLAPFMVQRGQEEVWVDGVEIVDSTGFKTILRAMGGATTPPAEMAERLLKELGEAAVSSILLRARHAESEASSKGWNAFLAGLGKLTRPQQELIRLVKETFGAETVIGTEEEALEQILAYADDPDFLDAFGENKAKVEHLLASLNTAKEDPSSISRSILHRIQSVLDPKARTAWRTLRKDIPESRRKEAEKLASGSMDRDVKFEIQANSEPEEVRAAVGKAVSRVMEVYLRIAEKAEALNCHAIWNGHLNFLSPEDSHLAYYDGGANVHLAITAKDDSVKKSTIEALFVRLSNELTSLHGQEEGVLRFIVQEGEKHYPPTDERTTREFLHFVHTQEDLAVNRIIEVLKGGATLNFRAPDYENLLKNHGLERVWERVQGAMLEQQAAK